MTDKEIIINDVDVSKCIHIDNWKHCNCCNDLIKTIYPKASQCLIEEDLRCEIYPNCYFKQLKRKEQECEELQEKIKKYSKINEQDTKDFAKLKQECKNLEEELRGCRIGIKDISIENTEICKISEKYKQALDEIEKYFKSKDKRKTSLFNIFVIEQEILNIINKAKEMSR